jgi:hypothetical protein
MQSDEWRTGAFPVKIRVAMTFYSLKLAPEIKYCHEHL